MSDEQRAIYKAGITPGMGYIAGPEGEKARAEALQKDEDISYRVVVNIVGKERQGKTSLRRFLAHEPFNPHEISTVGVDHELVDTKGLTESWTPLSIREANMNEYDLVLGKWVRHRLGNMKKKRSNSFYLAHILCFAKIFGIFYLMMLIHYTLLRLEPMQGVPWFGCLLTVCFAIAALAFGVNDGFGIAVGVYALLVKCDGFYRWQPMLLSHFRDVKHSTFAIVPYAEAYIICAVLECFHVIPLGSSFGKGMAFVLCIFSPPHSQENVSEHPLLNLHVHIFAIISILSIATSKFRRVRYLCFLPIAGLLAAILPEEYSYTFLCALGCGQSHVFCLRQGQNLYLIMNNRLKHYFAPRWQRRLLVDMVGIFPGILAAIIFGWEPSLDIPALHLGCGFMFMASIHVLNHLMNHTEAPAPSGPKVKSPSDVLVNRIRTPCIKLILKDFAGHPLYHCAHHIYMSGQSIYVIVFNLEEAKSSYDGTLAQVLYWFQTIYAHAHFPNVSIILVGTHRDSAVLKPEDRHIIGKQLREDIPDKFHPMLVWNDWDVPFFAVENSCKNDRDADHVKLRETILDVAKNASFRKETWPIRYLAFFKIIETFRSEGKLMEDVRSLLDIVKSSECGVQNPVQLEDLLLHFDSVGEIMYNIKDNRLKHLVIFDPRILVNLIGAIVTIPSRHQRSREVFMDWAKLEETGLCSGKLFEHVIKENAPTLHDTVGYKRLARLLECYDLLCQIHLPVDIQTHLAIGEYYLIPTCLPIAPRFNQNIWETSDTDDVIFVDFGSIDPSSIFLRLVCQCTAYHSAEVTPEGVYLLNVSQTCALFNFGRTHSYKIEMLHPKVQGRRGQELIRITIRSWNGTGCLSLLRQLNTRLVKIVRGNFEQCDYRLGVRCPCSDPHEYYEGEDVPILPLTGSSSNDREYVPVQKEFWCRGRKILVESGKARMCGEESADRVLFHRVDSRDLGSLHVLDLPETMYRYICDSLNSENILAKDWKGLAGVLQLTHRQVEQLVRQHDPCDSLFKHWGIDPGATVEKLTQKLTEIHREDLVTYLEEANSFTGM